MNDLDHPQEDLIINPLHSRRKSIHQVFQKASLKDPY